MLSPTTRFLVSIYVADPAIVRLPMIETSPGNVALLGKLRVTVDPDLEALIWLGVPDTDTTTFKFDPSPKNIPDREVAETELNTALDRPVTVLLN